MSCQSTLNPADGARALHYRRLLASIFPAYLAVSIFSESLSQGALGMLFPALSGILFFAVIFLSAFFVYYELDEFQRVLMGRSLLWAAVLTLASVSVLGHLELAEARHLPHIPLLAIPVMLILLTSAFKVVIFRRFRSVPE